MIGIKLGYLLCAMPRFKLSARLSVDRDKPWINNRILKYNTPMGNWTSRTPHWQLPWSWGNKINEEDRVALLFCARKPAAAVGFSSSDFSRLSPGRQRRARRSLGRDPLAWTEFIALTCGDSVSRCGPIRGQCCHTPTNERQELWDERVALTVDRPRPGQGESGSEPSVASHRG